MNDPSSLLATIAQSSAAIVAIIGGFLVSRLVALSSEREGIKRQLKAAKEEVKRLTAEWQPAHEYRLSNSISTMEDWLLDGLTDDYDQTNRMTLDELLTDRVPRGSSFEEMRPYAEAFRGRVQKAYKQMRSLLIDGDDARLDLDELQSRGFRFDESDREIVEAVVDTVASQLPRAVQRNAFGLTSPDLSGLVRASAPRFDGQFEVEMRRLDDSIREEANLCAQLDSAEQASRRLEHDLAVFAQPVGVVSATLILGLFSLLGIFTPLLVMAFGPARPSAFSVSVLLGCFAVGLLSVLTYILWYFKKVSA